MKIFKEAYKVNSFLFQNILNDQERLAINAVKESGISGRLEEWPILQSALLKMGFDLSEKTDSFLLKNICQYLLNLINNKEKDDRLKKIVLIDGIEDNNMIFYIYHPYLDEYQQYEPDFLKNNKKIDKCFLEKEGFTIIYH